MIDFGDTPIRSMCHPLRMYSDSVASRLQEEISEIGNDKATEADELIIDGEYNEAIKVLDSMIERLEELEETIQGEHPGCYKEVYDEVDNTSYHGKVVRAAEEHGYSGCVLGALKSAKDDLEQHPF